MPSVTASMLDFLGGPHQFSIPIFRRRYSWTKKNCKQLLDNILRVGSNDNIQSHFFGSIVYIDRHVTAIGDVRKLIVIDGHQRLATLSLLLSALSLTIKDKDGDIGTSAEELQNYYLFNNQEGELRYKLLLTKEDKETLIDLLENRFIFPPTNPSSLLVGNYEYFKNRLKKVDLKDLYAGIKKLEIASVVPDPADDPRKIVETFNATEISFSQADLIRNYVFINLEPTFQEKLYENYWFPMEQLFGNEYAKCSDAFMKNYLTLKMGQVLSGKRVYEKFKEYCPVNGNSEQLEKIIIEIGHHAKHYVNMVLLKDRDRELWKCFSDLAELQADASYPFLLEVYDDYNQELIEKSDFIKILRLVESYVFRLAVCSVSPASMNVMNKVFAELMSKVDKMKCHRLFRPQFSKFNPSFASRIP